jgi:hypothetical protein
MLAFSSGFKECLGHHGHEKHIFKMGRPFLNPLFMGYLRPPGSCPADSVSLGHLGQTHTVAAVTGNGGAIEVERGTTNAAPFQFGSTHPSSYSLDNKIALQLGVLRRTVIADYVEHAIMQSHSTAMVLWPAYQ